MAVSEPLARDERTYGKAIFRQRRVESVEVGFRAQWMLLLPVSSAAIPMNKQISEQGTSTRRIDVPRLRSPRDPVNRQSLVCVRLDAVQEEESRPQHQWQ